MNRWRSGEYEEISQHEQILDHCPDLSSRSSVSSSETEVDRTPSSRRIVQSNEIELASSEYRIYGFRKNCLRSFIFHTLSIALLGIPYLISIWMPGILVLMYEKCDLPECDIVLLRNKNIGLTRFIKVTTLTNTAIENASETIKLFEFEETRYVWDDIPGQYLAIKYPHENRTISEICSDRGGLLEEKRPFYLKYYGLNEIHINVKSYWRLFIDEILNPFYVFQICSLIFWCLDDYYYYAICIVILSAISIGTSLYETKKQSLTLRDLVEKSRPQCVKVKQRISILETQITQMSPVHICPGDILMIESSFILPCDCLLLEGQCIVNECMLTGESVPVNKVAVDVSNEYLFNEDRFKRSMLYAGTEVIQIRNGSEEYVKAKVLKVGFKTNKGELIKSILYPKPIGFKFYKDSIKFVIALFCISIFGMVYTLRLFLRRHETIQTTLLKTLDVITIVVPPSLPVAMTAGTIYSQSRLKKKGIFCVSPPQINVCGKMKLCCFDKTGTLTEDGLTFHGIIYITGNNLFNKLESPLKFSMFNKFIQGMATCHSLIEHNDTIIGDPLDLEMFNATDWVICKSGAMSKAPKSVMPKSEQGKTIDNDVPYVIGIYKEFEFTSEEQCMSVLVQILGHNNYLLFVKGAPERVHKMLDPKSIPKNFDETLNRYANFGYRILALGYREFSRKDKFKDLIKRDRKEMETEIQFLGFIVFQNKLKKETTPTIEDLKGADLRIVMATGDNILTAISVARESKIVSPDEKIFKIELDKSYSKLLANEVFYDNSGSIPRIQIENEWNNHFALDGSTWEALRTHRPDLLPKVLTKGTIFARFRPEQKSQLVMDLIYMDYIVTMCGDGANDCTALKSANIGVSLSQAEASVAAPFTSNVQNIECIKHLALEGRCALVTSFSLFKYIILYSIIQFCTVLILYSYCTTLGDAQFLYIDLAITASIAFSMGLQKPRSVLVSKRPSSSLISPLNIIPLILQILFAVAFQMCAVIFLTNQPWYDVDAQEDRCTINDTTTYKAHPYLGMHKEQEIVSWENTVLFCISSFQYLLIGLIYSKGKPFRKPFYTNVIFMVAFLFLMTFTSILLLYPPESVAGFFEVKNFIEESHEQTLFRFFLVVFPVLHFITTFLIEFGISDRLWLKRTIHWITRKSKPRNRYKQLQSSFSIDDSWIEFL